MKRFLSLAIGGLLVGTAATVILPVTVAHADICDQGVNSDGDVVTVCYQTSSPGNQGGIGGPRRRGTVGTPVEWFYFKAETFELKDDTGKLYGYCVGTFRSSNQGFALVQNDIFKVVTLYYRVRGASPMAPCPIKDPPRIPLPNGSANPINNASVTQAFRQELRDAQQLAPPQLHASPSNAVSGLPVFMTIGGAQNVNIDLLRVIAGHQVHLVLNSTYTIDWGDGTRDVTSSQGGPFPNGDVQHSYDDARSFTVSVQQHWKGTWTSDDGRTGTIVGDPLTQATTAVAIEQAESVLKS